MHMLINKVKARRAKRMKGRVDQGAGDARNPVSVPFASMQPTRREPWLICLAARAERLAGLAASRDISGVRATFACPTRNG
jgi:hypothetical protein